MENVKIELGKHSTYGKNGIRQGSRIAPKLWLLYYQPLLDKLKENGFNNIYAFADDLAIIDESNNLSKAWKIINEWSRENGQKPNPKKRVPGQ